MATASLPLLRRARGVSLVEVLVTVVILAFGLLGLAAFQSKAQIGTLESYQRAQAIVLLEDLQARMLGNPGMLASYVTATAGVGTGTAAADCAAMANGPARDLCEWGAALRGAAEKSGSTEVGGMIGARGCVEELQKPDPNLGVCKHGIYRLSIAWQGMHQTRASDLVCGKTFFGSDDKLRRVIAVRVAVATPNCK